MFVYQYKNFILGSAYKKDDCIFLKNKKNQIIKMSLKSFRFLNYADFFYLTQVHSNKVLNITKNNFQNLKGAQADGIYSDLKRVLFLCLTADCASVILINDENNLYSIFHAGYKGVTDGIVKNAVAAVSSQTDPKNLKCFIMPAAKSCCYEFDVKTARKHGLYYKPHNKQKNKCFVDMQETLKKFLTLEGVSAANIFIKEECSVCGEDYHSYRQNKTFFRTASFVFKC